MNITPSLYEKNAKKHSPEQIYKIALSLRSFGWQQPIKIGKDGIIIVGHGRWLAYDKYKDELSLKEPWIIDEQGNTVAGQPEQRVLSDDEERAYRLADNLIAGTDYDMEKVLEQSSQLNSEFQEMLKLDLVDTTQKEDVKEQEHINDEKYLAYLNNTIRQVVLHYPQEEFSVLIEKCEFLTKKLGFETNSELFAHLVNLEHAKHQN